MPKQYNIRWSESDVKNLRNTIRAFNSKITRVGKNSDVLPYLPAYVNIQEITQQITTRAEYNKVIRRLKRFLKPDAEKLVTGKQGLTLTRYDLGEVRINLARANRELSAQRKKIQEIKERGAKNVGKKAEFLPDIDVVQFSPIKFDIDKIRPGREFELKKEAIEVGVKSRDFSKFKQYYVQAVQTEFGYEAAIYIATLLDQLDLDQVQEVYYSNPDASIDFIYEPAEAAIRFTTIMDIWERAVNGK